MSWTSESERLSNDLLEAARRQILDICGHLENRPDDRLFIAVHQARKRIKELRALLRLTRKRTGETFYRQQNLALRSMARSLAPMRDAAVLLATWHALRESLPEKISKREFATVAKKLSLARPKQPAATARSRRQLKQKLESAVAVLEKLPVRDITKHDIRSGLKRARRRYRAEQRKARRSSTDENLHAWRKRVKDLTHQLELVGDSISKRTGRHNQQLKKLGRLLGEDHDLALFETVIGKIQPDTGKKLREPIKKHRKELRKAAFKLGRKL